jgi:hypothetical protein
MYRSGLIYYKIEKFSGSYINLRNFKKANTILMRSLLFLLVFLSSVHSFAQARDQRCVFFLHNMFLETAGMDDAHPEYGKYEYKQILSAFEKEGFIVFSEIRKRGTDGDTYAAKVRGQVDSLLKKGVKPGHITVVGTSKGAYITWRASALLKNKDVNFVLIGICNEGTLEQKKGFDPYGNILSIYEHSDALGQSCSALKARSPGTMPHFKEIELNTGLKHGFLYKASPGWLTPTMMWAKGNYTF